ncbi:MAG: AtpZ/AtpI family protein [Anaerolineaceae bacterium]|nr:AtpZ/AtpI family protein [Anaerolineaceae bacterium]
MSGNLNPQPKNSKYWLNLTLAGVVVQVGCLTLVIILVALFGGLWLDARFQTKPVITLVLVFASIPVSLVLMFVIARSAAAKIKANVEEQRKEEAGIGKPF